MREETRPLTSFSEKGSERKGKEEGPTWARREARKGLRVESRWACTSTLPPSLVRRVHEGGSREMAFK